MTDGEAENVDSASLQKIKPIKNPIKKKNLFYLIKSETSDSFVNHFDGHFAYLKTLDFYFKKRAGWKMAQEKSVKKSHTQTREGSPRTSWTEQNKTKQEPSEKWAQEWKGKKRNGSEL